MSDVVLRDWSRIERHIRQIDGRDVPCDPDGKAPARRLGFVALLPPFLEAAGVRTVLDVGCAGITRQWWIKQGYEWHGLTFPRDAEKLRASGVPVAMGDVASMPYDDGAFDLVYASHVLEHSVMPVVALLECRRVARIMVMCAPKWPRMVGEPYHYSCMPAAAWKHLLTVAGWTIAGDLSGAHDYAYICAHEAADLALLKPAVAEYVARRKAHAVEKKKRRRARNWTKARTVRKG